MGELAAVAAPERYSVLRVADGKVWREPLPKPAPLSWGLRVLDRVVGPLIPGRLYVIGARPSCGKTTFVLNWLDQYVARLVLLESEGRLAGFPLSVGMFLTERTREVAVRAWACMKLGYDADAVLCDEWGRLPHGAEQEVEQVEAMVMEWAEAGVLHFLGQTRPTCSIVDTEVRKVGAQVVIFDYIQRVRPEGRQSKFDAVAEAAHLFQTLANEGRVVIVMSQLKRRGDGVFDKYRPPHLEDFKGAGEIEENADVALGLYRPLGRMTAKEEREVRAGERDLEAFKIHDTMAVKVLKHRYRGPAADQLVRITCRDGRLTDAVHEGPPPDAGDAWEDGDAPF